VATYLPEFGNNGKELITVEDLLLHRGGLIPDNPLSEYVGTREQMIEKIMQSKLKWEPRTHFAYTDVGFEVLGELVHRIDGRPLDQFAREELFIPLGMTETMYQPPAELRSRIAPTEKRDGEWIVGVVHDPRAFALGGVAGHAGLFGSAADVSKWVRMINSGGVHDGKRVLSEAMVARMLTLQALPDGTGGRGLGVDIDSSFSSPRGDRFNRGTTFGHTGWTARASGPIPTATSM
jgi:CubicO group peptidase (beta-lactamase class C family)